MTSTALPALISVQDSQTSQGSALGRSVLPIALRQLSAMARMRGDGRLTDASWPREDVAVGDALLRERVHQGDRDVVLACDIGEPLRAVFTG